MRSFVQHKQLTPKMYESSNGINGIEMDYLFVFFSSLKRIFFIDSTVGSFRSDVFKDPKSTQLVALPY